MKYKDILERTTIGQSCLGDLNMVIMKPNSKIKDMFEATETRRLSMDEIKMFAFMCCDYIISKGFDSLISDDKILIFKLEERKNEN